MDVASINARLGQAASVDSRELDRVCEQIAAELIDANVEPPFRIPTADFDVDAWLICADRYWRRRLLDAPTVETAARCAHWLYEHAEAPTHPHIVEKWTMGYAFITRDNVESRHDLTLATGRIVEASGGSADVCSFAALYHAGKLRMNSSFDELRQFLESSLLAVAAGPHRDTALFTALRAFAALGSPTITTAHAVELFDGAWNALPRTRAVVDVCLHALAEAEEFPGQGELLRDRAALAVVDHPNDHLFRYRLAHGQRLCGDYADAKASIIAALRLLPAIGTRISFGTLQEQYRLERTMIDNERRLAELTDGQQARWREQDAANRDVRRLLQTSTVRAIELVSVFTAAIAVSVGSIQVTLTGDMSFHDRALLLVVLGAVLLAFATAIVAGTWYIAGRHQSDRTDASPDPGDHPR